MGNVREWLPVGTDGIHSSSEFCSQWYHKQYPEYTISYSLDDKTFINGRIDEIESGMYWLNMMNRKFHNTYCYNLSIKYHNTILYSTLCIFADGYRFNRILWKQDYIKYSDNIYFNYSFIEKTV